MTARYTHRSSALPGGPLGGLPSLSLTTEGSWIHLGGGSPNLSSARWRPQQDRTVAYYDCMCQQESTDLITARLYFFYLHSDASGLMLLILLILLCSTQKQSLNTNSTTFEHQQQEQFNFNHTRFERLFPVVFREVRNTNLRKKFLLPFCLRTWKTLAVSFNPIKTKYMKLFILRHFRTTVAGS